MNSGDRTLVASLTGALAIGGIGAAFATAIHFQSPLPLGPILPILILTLIALVNIANRGEK